MNRSDVTRNSALTPGPSAAPAPHDQDLRVTLPKPGLIGIFACAITMTFAIIFTISAAVMTAPRDVRLAEDRQPLKPASSAKTRLPLENAALMQLHSVR